MVCFAETERAQSVGLRPTRFESPTGMFEPGGGRFIKVLNCIGCPVGIVPFRIEKFDAHCAEFPDFQAYREIT
jgi:hypothetical protein